MCCGCSGEEGHVQTVYVADASGGLCALKFWGGLAVSIGRSLCLIGLTQTLVIWGNVNHTMVI